MVTDAMRCPSLIRHTGNGQLTLWHGRQDVGKWQTTFWGVFLLIWIYWFSIYTVILWGLLCVITVVITLVGLHMAKMKIWRHSQNSKNLSDFEFRQESLLMPLFAFLSSWWINLVVRMLTKCSSWDEHPCWHWRITVNNKIMHRKILLSWWEGW